jgi:hypothetical protein
MQTQVVTTTIGGEPLQGMLILSAERVAGVTASSSSTSTTTTITSPGSATITGSENIDRSSTNVDLLWNGGGANPFAIPRLAIDFFVASQVTLGGSAGYMSRSGSSKTSSVVKSSSSGSSISASSDDDLPDTSAFVFSPRLGVVLTLGPSVALWLRGGVTYFHSSEDSTTTLGPDMSLDGLKHTTKTSTETSGTAATLDAQLVLVPMDHVGITIGPVFDFALGGSIKSTITDTATGTGAFGTTNTSTTTTNTEGDLSHSNYGVAAGIVAFF